MKRVITGLTILSLTGAARAEPCFSAFDLKAGDTVTCEASCAPPATQAELYHDHLVKLPDCKKDVASVMREAAATKARLEAEAEALRTAHTACEDDGCPPPPRAPEPPGFFESLEFWIPTTAILAFVGGWVAAKKL
jgi:hypothetical protein